MDKNFRVWYIPQIPWEAYKVYVDTITEWILVAKTIIWLSIFEFENKIKPDYSDAIWLEEKVDWERSERMNDEWETIDDILE